MRLHDEWYFDVQQQLWYAGWTDKCLLSMTDCRMKGDDRMADSIERQLREMSSTYPPAA